MRAAAFGVDGGPPGRTVLAPEQTPLPEADTDAPVLRMEQGLSRTGPLDPGPWQARIVVKACQCWGKAAMTASTFLSSSTFCRSAL